MSSTTSKVTLRTAGTAGIAVLAAAAIGSSVAPVAEASRVRCTVNAAGFTNIASQDGFANALVELAEFACNDVGEGTVPINERVTTVASAMAEAVAEVIGQCSGEGNARATISGLSRAETRAEAVGTASARIVATAGVCGQCSGALDSFSTAIETVAATATAEASLMAEFTFEEGESQMFTASDIQRSVEENIIELLATVTGEIHASPEDGCSGNADVESGTENNSASCDVSFSASDISEERDAVADAGVAVRALACSGNGNDAEIRVITREIAEAVAMAVVQADSFCESSGGPGTMSCAISNGTVTAVARATAQALASGLAEAGGDGCDCDVSNAIDIEDVVEIMAEASTTGVAEACSDGNGFAIASDFQKAVEEAVGVAVAEVVASAVSGVDCSVDVSVCADASQCVESFQRCSGPGMERTLTCCEEDDVCTTMFGESTFRCRPRDVVERTETAEVMACP